MEKRYKYMDGYLSRDLIFQIIHPLRDAAFGADCLTPLRISKIITVGLKMDSGKVHSLSSGKVAATPILKSFPSQFSPFIL